MQFVRALNPHVVQMNWLPDDKVRREWESGIKSVQVPFSSPPGVVDSRQPCMRISRALPKALGRKSVVCMIAGYVIITYEGIARLNHQS